jgi:serine/threonine protein kinase
MEKTTISLFHYFFYLLFLLFLTIYHSTSFSFNYNLSDPTSDRSSLRLEGDAFFDGDVINLSRYNADGNMDRSQGRVTYKKPILLWDSSTGKVANFTTSFTFAIRYTDIEQNGDGMTFFLLPFPSHLTDRSSQGCLSAFENCYSPSTTTKNHVVAVEFDSYMNDWDPSSNHFGIDVNSISSVVYQNITLISNNTDMRITSNITYNSYTKLLTALVYSDDIPGFGNYSLSVNVDLMRILPPEVAIGFSGATRHARYVELHQIFSWYFKSTLEPKNNFRVYIVLVIGLVICLLIIAGLGSILWWKKYKIQSYKEVEMHESVYEELTKQAGPKVFQYDELLVATKNFAEEQKLGRGAFGWVYIGFLTELKIYVAIKRLGKTYEQGIREFTTEVGIISRLRHRNLVELIGWCHHHKELLLVYEYMPNGSLDTHLYPQNTGTTLTLQWSLRYKIALGLGSAISYLHRDWNQCVVHRDIKPSNIMLDSNFNAKLGDFGLARLIDHIMGTQTTDPAGTIGYLAPECFYTGRTSKESDVYSFGIVLLEIACGRMPSGRRPEVPGVESPNKRLVEWIWELYGQNRILEAADDRLDGDFEAGQMERVMVVGLWCAHPDDSQRPNIKKAMDVLCFESPLPFLPSQMPVPMYAAPMENISISSHSARTSSARSTIAWWTSSFFWAFAGSMSAWLSGQQPIN